MLLAACGGKPLYSQLEEGQANQIMGVLIAAGIDADNVARHANRRDCYQVVDIAHTGIVNPCNYKFLRKIKCVFGIQI